ncbi:hypothetical protein SODALDRAFT_362446 [Sodiomyces alkalinus F11]|uniref:Uncharacterized protein n=1 Tax=Sodiomyces alkalinus (strain CBS 110278 / VKM F-3762 / F11) TaxID=1314773 RepID=A0A3N2PQ53_SODAK|nr:hypothetical protein SODALDRAFT_362446 [Sodiomyces alkalinus F11]ROT36625.1 hypothetical protein SODALDRAFT_362446 [Sodiomyces alkalinus F11]
MASRWVPGEIARPSIAELRSPLIPMFSYPHTRIVDLSLGETTPHKPRANLDKYQSRYDKVGHASRNYNTYVDTSLLCMFEVYEVRSTCEAFAEAFSHHRTLALAMNIASFVFRSAPLRRLSRMRAKVYDPLGHVLYLLRPSCPSPGVARLIGADKRQSRKSAQGARCQIEPWPQKRDLGTKSHRRTVLLISTCALMTTRFLQIYPEYDLGGTITSCRVNGSSPGRSWTSRPQVAGGLAGLPTEWEFWVPSFRHLVITGKGVNTFPTSGSQLCFVAEDDELQAQVNHQPPCIVAGGFPPAKVVKNHHHLGRGWYRHAPSLSPHPKPENLSASSHVLLWSYLVASASINCMGHTFESRIAACILHSQKTPNAKLAH